MFSVHCLELIEHVTKKGVSVRRRYEIASEVDAFLRQRFNTHLRPLEMQEAIIEVDPMQMVPPNAGLYDGTLLTDEKYSARTLLCVVQDLIGQLEHLTDVDSIHSNEMQRARIRCSELRAAYGECRVIPEHLRVPPVRIPPAFEDLIEKAIEQNREELAPSRAALEQAFSAFLVKLDDVLGESKND